MRKIVKYCSVCEESFSEKFSFCPNCSSALSAYEMNPVAVGKSKNTDAFEITEKFVNSLENEVLPDNDLSEIHSSVLPQEYDDGIYHLALVEAENNSVRNSLLLGAFVLVALGTFSGVVVSIFNTSLNIAQINNDSVIAYMSPLSPENLNEEKPPMEKKKNDAGGGGTGGNDDSDPVSKGRESRMLENPLVAPSVKTITMTNPDMKLQPAVKGPEVDYKEDKTQPYGSKNSVYTIPSDGPGSNGGQGTGFTRGQGEGAGPGIGPGKDGGKGGGEKGGIGPGVGPGIYGRDPKDKDKDKDGEIPPEVRKETIALKINYKPKAIYTDGARENAVQGTVTLRVTFLANGSIGSITTVSGLPNGLTEQAIAAARSIRFEPQKINGVAQTVSRQIQYTFTLF